MLEQFQQFVRVISIRIYSKCIKNLVLKQKNIIFDHKIWLLTRLYQRKRKHIFRTNLKIMPMVLRVYGKLFVFSNKIKQSKSISNSSVKGWCYLIWTYVCNNLEMFERWYSWKFVNNAVFISRLIWDCKTKVPI